MASSSMGLLGAIFVSFMGCWSWSYCLANCRKGSCSEYFAWCFGANGLSLVLVGVIAEKAGTASLTSLSKSLGLEVDG